MKRPFLAFFFLVELLAPPAARAQPSFIFPLSCRLGEDCWTANYVDDDPAPGSARDFTCGALTYDEHQGTDFAIRDIKAMEEGVDVLAAAPGKVLRTRDGIEDRQPTPEDMDDMKVDKKGCGNGVLVDHGGGWQTIYCHMRKGSIAVAPGQEVHAGERLGAVGQSGIAEFPHLHFGVFYEGHTIDPFTGRELSAGCGVAAAKPLWGGAVIPVYSPVTIYAAGFAPAVPDFEDIKHNVQSPGTLPAAGAKALLFWTALYGVATGDKIHLEITDAAGHIFAVRDITQEKSRARQFYYVGKKVNEDGLTPGEYTGRITLSRTLPGGRSLVRTMVRRVTVAVK
jgi:hypothetical protein